MIIHAQESAVGPAYRVTNRGPDHPDITITFPFGVAPHLYVDSWTRGVIVESPERFGSYATPRQRRAWVIAFATPQQEDRDDS